MAGSHSSARSRSRSNSCSSSTTTRLPFIVVRRTTPLQRRCSVFIALAPMALAWMQALFGLASIYTNVYNQGCRLPPAIVPEIIRYGQAEEQTAEGRHGRLLVRGQARHRSRLRHSLFDNLSSAAESLLLPRLYRRFCRRGNPHFKDNGRAD